MDSSLLDVRGLTVSYVVDGCPVRAVREATFRIRAGETVALVGETGSGKSSIALAVLGLLDIKSEIVAGGIGFGGKELLELSSAEWRKVRGSQIALVSQNPRSSLNPVLTVFSHLKDAMLAHRHLTTRQIRERSRALLQEVGIPDPASTLDRFPLELSGGMCQRVAIALGLCNHPRLLIADEPTSALDPTIQAQVLDLLGEMKRRYDLSILLITHDLPLAAEFADRVMVMYHGRLVEEGLAAEVLQSPRHPYTTALLGSLPSTTQSARQERLRPIPGSPPSSGEELSGCHFAPRCPVAEPECTRDVPPSVGVSETHWAACIKAR